MKTTKQIFAHGLLVLLAAAIGQQSWALPLVSENEKRRVTDLVTLYPDHEDPTKFYYFPNSSHLAVNDRGLPLFSLTHYGLSNGGPIAQAGGLMVFTFRLTSDRSQQAALQTFLDNNPNYGIAPVPVKASILRLGDGTSQTQPLKKFIDELVLPPHGGRAEDEMGVTASLTGIGAKVLKASILNNAGDSQFQLNYCYKFEGLGPDMDAKIKVKMDRVYDHFKGTASGGWGWFRASITREVEKLRDQRDISIEINGGNATDEEYIREIAEQIISRLFVPELSTNPAGVRNGQSFSTSFFSFGGGSVHRSELKTETWTYVRRRLVEREFCPAIPLRDVAPHRKKLIIDADKVDVNLNHLFNTSLGGL